MFDQSKRILIRTNIKIILKTFRFFYLQKYINTREFQKFLQSLPRKESRGRGREGRRERKRERLIKRERERERKREMKGRGNKKRKR